MQLNPKHLMMLADIYDAGGFTEAAISLNTTQPGLSRIVKAVEQRIGEPVFIRVRKPLQLTPIGERLVDQGRAIRTATNRASESVDRIRSGEEGELRIGGTPFFIDGFISGLIAEFQTERYNVTVRLIHGYPDDLIAQLIANRLDAALCPIDIIDPDAGIEFVPLIRGHNVVACRVGHPLRSKKEIKPLDLLQFPWVAPPPLSPLSDDLKRVLSSFEASHINVIASGGGLGSVVNYVVHSDCLTILPHTVVFAMRHQGALSALPVDLNHPSRTLGILTPRFGTMIPVVRKLSEFMKSRMAAMQDQINSHEREVYSLV
ncbi:MAG: LysR family transcriptional regulator [Pseudomonadota bacterium]